VRPPAATDGQLASLVWAAVLGVFIVGNLLCAIAPGYWILMGARIVTAFCHGAFFGIGSVVAAGLVAPEKAAGAIAVMFTGLTAANVLGVPFGTFLGQQFGWRATFWAIAVIGVLALIGIAALVPALHRDGPAPSLRRELGAFRSGQVWLSLLVTVLGFGGMFGAFTYIAYTLTRSFIDPKLGPPMTMDERKTAYDATTTEKVRPESPSPAKNQSPKRLDCQCGSSDISQSMAAKLPVSARMRKPAAEMPCRRRRIEGSPVSSCRRESCVRSHASAIHTAK